MRDKDEIIEELVNYGQDVYKTALNLKETDSKSYHLLWKVGALIEEIEFHAVDKQNLLNELEGLLESTLSRIKKIKE